MRAFHAGHVLKFSHEATAFCLGVLGFGHRAHRLWWLLGCLQPYSKQGFIHRGLAFLIAGAVMLLLFAILALASKRQGRDTPVSKEEPSLPTLGAEAEKEEPKAAADPQREAQAVPENEPEALEEPQKGPDLVCQAREPKENPGPACAPKRSDEGTIYVKRLGYGPVLRIEGDEILEMRSNTYYRIEGNYVKRSGGGPAFEISSNRIKSAYGSGLYEISGDNVSKTFGGHYAGFSGNRLQTNDLREQYECTGSLNLRQKLTVVALLFGSY